MNISNTNLSMTSTTTSSLVFCVHYQNNRRRVTTIYELCEFFQENKVLQCQLKVDGEFSNPINGTKIHGLGALTYENNKLYFVKRLLLQIDGIYQAFDSMAAFIQKKLGQNYSLTLIEIHPWQVLNLWFCIS